MQDGKRSKFFGACGEKEAAKYLQSLGLKIVKQNALIYLNKNCRRIIGEIDIIASDGSTLIFTEVKWRKDSRYGSPLEAVTEKKQQKLRNAALAYIASEKPKEKRFRFDVIGITGIFPFTKIEHVQNAF